MDKALVYGTRDSGFDPQRSRFFFLLSLTDYFRGDYCMHTLEASKSFIKKKFWRVHALVLEF